MKFKFRIVALIAVAITLFVGCNKDVLDLSLAIVNEPAPDKLSKFADTQDEQDGVFEMSVENGVKLVSNGEKVHYFKFLGENSKEVMYANTRLSESRDAVVAILKDKVCFLRVYIDNRDAMNLLSSISDEINKADSVINDLRLFEDSEQETVNFLKSTFPKLVKDSVDYSNSKKLFYPSQIILANANDLTIYSLDPVGTNLNLSIRKISKEAYLEHYIEEYAKPEIEAFDAPFKNLFKK